MTDRRSILTQPSSYVIFMSLIFITSGILRFAMLDADPPPRVGVHFISDEGWWVHNARNKILFGKWILDDFNQSLLVSPPFCLSTYVVYRILGVNFYSSRVIPALSGLLSVLLFSLILRKHLDAARTLAGTAFLGLGFGFCTMNRIAYVDSTAFLFLMLAWWLMERFPYRVAAVVSSGFFFGMAVMTKSYALSLAPVLMVLSLHRARATGRRAGDWAVHVFLFGTGFLVTALFWYKAVYIPFSDSYAVMYHLWRDGNLPSGIFQTVRNIPTLLIRANPNGIFAPRFILLNVVLLAAVWWRLVMVTHPRSGLLRHVFSTLSVIERESIIWILIHAATIAPLTAKPFRRYLFLYPPLICLALWATRQISTQDRTVSSFARRFFHAGIAACFPALLLGISSADGVIRFFHSTRFVSGHRTLAASAIAGIFCLLFILGAFYLFKHRRWHVLPIKWLIIVWLIWNGTLYVDSLRHLSFTLRDTSRRLGSGLFGEGRVVLGGIADTLCMETPAQAVAIWGRQEAPRVLNENPVERFRPDYIVVLTRIDGLPWARENRYYRYLKPENKRESLHLCPTGKGSSFRFEADIYAAPRPLSDDHTSDTPEGYKKNPAASEPPGFPGIGW